VDERPETAKMCQHVKRKCQSLNTAGEVGNATSLLRV